MKRRTRWLIATFVGVSTTISLLVSCSASDTLNPRTDEPVLLLVLSDSASNPFQPALTALLANTGRPSQTEYRSAEQFHMFRERDGAQFLWSEVAGPSLQGSGATFLPTGGNYLLEARSTAAGLGRDALRAGERYSLEIETLNRTIVGSTRIPPAPILRLEQSGLERRLVWSRIPGVERYLISGTGRDPFGAVADTFITIAQGLQTPALVYVFALDSNYARYLQDTTVFSAGITGGYGVFGAVSGSAIELTDQNMNGNLTKRSDMAR